MEKHNTTNYISQRKNNFQPTQPKKNTVVDYCIFTHTIQVFQWTSPNGTLGNQAQLSIYCQFQSSESPFVLTQHNLEAVESLYMYCTNCLMCTTSSRVVSSLCRPYRQDALQVYCQPCWKQTQTQAHSVKIV